MLERGSPAAILIGRWGAALALVIGTVLIGRFICTFPYRLPKRLPGLVLYELGPALILAIAMGNAIAITNYNRPRFGIPRGSRCSRSPHDRLHVERTGDAHNIS